MDTIFGGTFFRPDRGPPLAIDLLCFIISFLVVCIGVQAGTFGENQLQDSRGLQPYTFSLHANLMIAIMFPESVVWGDVAVTNDVSWVMTQEPPPVDFEEAYKQQLFMVPATLQIEPTSLQVIDEPMNSQYLTGRASGFNGL